MYEIILEEQAKQFIKSLNKNRQKVILNKIEKLAENPYLGKSLIGKLAGLRTLRIDKFRIIYTIKSLELVVLVLKAGNRNHIYFGSESGSKLVKKISK